jgi:hypothetical protein
VTAFDRRGGESGGICAASIENLSAGGLTLFADERLLKAEEVVAETFGQLERRIFLLASCQVHRESKRCIH